MMEVGREKVRAKELEHVISFERQASESMTFPDNTFHAVISSFGVRNFQSIDQSFQEVLRVLKPGGTFLFIELSTPELSPAKELYALYSKHVMPVMAGLFTKNEKEYAYLPNSVALFPQGREMMGILDKNGFRAIRLRRFTLGIATMYLAEK
jgi:demethylmenaquinone methyltransferase/2-methoxy-6-polyprenyl-1,4-benzoquinol methylase